MFDTHCHFEEDETILPTLKRAKEAGINYIAAIGGTEELNRTAILASTLQSSETPIVFPCIGYDRTTASQTLPPLPPCAPKAIGEIGLDYYYAPETRQAQLARFEEQISLANNLDLPIIVHTRAADEDTLAILRSTTPRGIIHCFTGTPDFCKKLLDLGFYISFSGIITFRSADNVRDSLPIVPLNRLLIETDSPYLAPVPMRGHPNEPSFLPHTATFITSLLNLPLSTLITITTQNAQSIF